MIKTKTIYRPIVTNQLNPRPLKDRDFEEEADAALQEAIRVDAEKFGFSEGYVLPIVQARKAEK
jgi:hypothetical protein